MVDELESLSALVPAARIIKIAQPPANVDTTDFTETVEKSFTEPGFFTAQGFRLTPRAEKA